MARSRHSGSQDSQQQDTDAGDQVAGEDGAGSQSADEGDAGSAGDDPPPVVGADPVIESAPPVVETPPDPVPPVLGEPEEELPAEETIDTGRTEWRGFLKELAEHPSPEVTAINQRLAECVPFLDGAIHRTEGTNRDALVHLKELLFGMRL